MPKRRTAEPDGTELVSEHQFAGGLVDSESRAAQDIAAIMALLPSVERVEEVLDTGSKDGGVDYLAHLKGGRAVPIDAKYRKAGAKKFWRYGEPELPMERWSVVPDDQNKGHLGWTLDTTKRTEMVLFTFAPEDSTNAYLIPFQPLRAAFLRMGAAWKSQYGRRGSQTNDGDWFYEHSSGGHTGKPWQSAAVFVPVTPLLDAVSRESTMNVETVPCASCGAPATVEVTPVRWLCSNCA